jgi:prepilin-type N-terminal cleavage/methylation domain-containing protein
MTGHLRPIRARAARAAPRTAFSLLEVLITMVVLGLALVPLMLSLRTSSTTVTGTRDYLSAVAFAQEALEEVRRTAFRRPNQAALATNVETLDDFVTRANQAARSTREVNGVRYTRRIDVYPSTSPGRVADLRPGQPDLVVVQVKVSWKPPGAGLLARTLEYQLISLVGSTNQP